CAQAHDRPGGLRRGARSPALENRIVVSVAAFTPAAPFVLDAFKPVTRLEQPWFLHVPVQRSHAAQHLPGAVDVVDAPAAIPRTVLFLMLTDEDDRVPHLRMVEVHTFVTEQLQNTRGDV